MNWIRPVQHRDPQGEWAEQDWTDEYKPEYAYDGSLETMAMARVMTPEQNLKEYGDHWSGWLELYPERPIKCWKMRLNYHKSNHYGNTEIQVKYIGEVWVTVYSGLPAIHTPQWHEIALDWLTRLPVIVYGLRIRFERPERLNGKKICFDVYGAEFYGELTDLPLIDPLADSIEPQGSVEITGVKWGFKPVPSRNATIWRTLEHLGSNQGLVPIMVTWRNLTDKPIKGTVAIKPYPPSYPMVTLRLIQGNDVVVYPNQSQAVMFEMPLVKIPPNNQGDWVLEITLNTEVYDDSLEWVFVVGVAPEHDPESIQDVAVWEIQKGSTPHHLPDSFEGIIDLDKLDVPPEVQGVYQHYISSNEGANEWLFWGNGAPGNTLYVLIGGEDADYMVTATGDCTWEIPLGEQATSDERDYLKVTKEVLRKQLESGDVAGDWWILREDYRRELAKHITQWFSVEEFGEPKHVAYSDTKPTKRMADFDELDQIEAHCAQETGLRYALIGGQHQPPDNLWYYTKQHGGYEWRKAKQDKPFGLPVYVAFINWIKEWDTHDEHYGHWACALQVGEDKSLMDSWVFFQFQEADIKVGDAQMQEPGDCTINEIIGYGSYGHPKAGAIVGHWEY